jgi:hypothetical protein
MVEEKGNTVKNTGLHKPVLLTMCWGANKLWRSLPARRHYPQVNDCVFVALSTMR